MFQDFSLFLDSRQEESSRLPGGKIQDVIPAMQQAALPVIDL